MNPDGSDAQRIDQRQQSHQREAFRGAVRALLMTPLMGPGHARFADVRRHAQDLRDWFAREAGWQLHVERDGARLYKRPADLDDTTRGLADFDRRRYVLLSLACAVLERGEAQITLRVLGERLLMLASDPALAARGFTFTLVKHHERKELVVVCRTLLNLGVLARVAGDEEAYVLATADADALYDVHRRALAGMLAAVRGPSTWHPDEAPISLDERLHALVDEHSADSEEARRTAIRHHLARRLLDDPVVYVDALPADVRSYFLNQRGALAGRIHDATGLTAEQRAEGLAMVDDDGELTDVSMPAEGTDAHATLLIAEHLARVLRDRATGANEHIEPVAIDALARFIADARERFGRYWRRSAREPGAEHELAATAVERLRMLQLVRVHDGCVEALPALARFALGEPQVRDARRAGDDGAASTASLF